jgi:hypothetical protein
MSANVTGSDSLGSTSSHSGIDAYNYSVDYMKKAAFHNELQRLESFPNLIENSVDRNMIICYLKDRIDQITKRYK